MGLNRDLSIQHSLSVVHRSLCVFYLLVMGSAGVSVPGWAAADKPMPVMHKETVILVHGFFRKSRDMRFIKQRLEQYGYRTIAPDLPTTYKSLDDCTLALEKTLGKIRDTDIRYHFVGHSMGGLIIRRFLSRNRIPNLGRCVFIATPNQGAAMAAKILKFARPVALLFKPLRDLRRGGGIIPPPLNLPEPEMGAIAGNRKARSWGRWLIHGENDGRVAVASVRFQGLKDFMVLPYDHHHIHHREETTLLVHQFLQTGRFCPSTFGGEGDPEGL